jgi:hypothetical protein
VGYAALTHPTVFVREIGFDVGAQGCDGRFEAVRDLGDGFAQPAAPETGDVRAGMRALQQSTQFGNPAIVARLRIQQPFHECQMLLEVIARNELVGGEKPNSSAAAQQAGACAGKVNFVLAMRTRRRGCEHPRDLARVEIVTSEPQRDEGFWAALTSVFIVEVFNRLASFIAHRTISA